MAVELGFSPGRAMAAGLLCFSAPTAFFFSTSIEVPALHLGVLALACALLLTLQRLAPATLFRFACVGLVPLLYFAHKSSVLLAPGWWVFVLDCERRRRGHPPGARLAVAWGLVLASAFALSILLGQALVPGNSIGDTLQFIERFEQSLGWAYLRDAVWAGLGLLVPLGLLGVLWTPPSERRWMLAFVLPVAAFFAWYGEINFGGYYISTVPFLALLAVRALPAGRAFWPLCLGVCLVQGALARRLVESANRGLDRAVHARKVEAARRIVGEVGLVVSFDPQNQPITLSMPGVDELNLRNELFAYGRSGGSAEAFARDLLLRLEPRRAVSLPTAIDLGGLLRANRRAESFMESLSASLEDQFGPADRSDPEHPLLRLPR
jgi:hypothetical protein